jgi:hypothetical protein
MLSNRPKSGIENVLRSPVLHLPVLLLIGPGWKSMNKCILIKFSKAIVGFSGLSCDFRIARW